MASQGKDNILIVAPDDLIMSAWEKAAPLFGLNISRLKDTKDSGKGIVITTYANFGSNDALVKRKWDMVVADESHQLSMNQSGDETLSLSRLRAITMHPRGSYDRYRTIHAEDIQRLKELLAEEGQEASKVRLLQEKLRLAQKSIEKEVEESQGAARPRVVFLSATPFAYEKNVDYAEGYLFNYGKEDGHGYNSGDGQARFMMQHFGYRMRYNKLTEPDKEVNRGLMQRQFNAWLKKEGVLSSRNLDVDFDYDRRFVLVESAVGKKIDEGMQWLFDNKRLWPLWEMIQDNFDYLSRRYLLEAIKAQEAIPIIKEHLKKNRKVVVFHDYIKGGGSNPFDLSNYRNSKEEVQSEAEDGSKVMVAIGDLVREFEAARPDLMELPIKSMPSPLAALSSAFPELLVANGQSVTKKEAVANVEKFNDDATGPAILMVQSDKDKGWSGHDTTGKYQRAMINLGLPTRPTRAIQQEGRIYRVGQASNAIFRYLNTGTNWERWAFATTIANRASAAENLAKGEEARALMDAFIQGFEESDMYSPGHEGEGTGGKERDAAANAALTEWDRATAMYFAQQKKTSRTKAEEGKDYFATPEPLGLKMVEWADIKAGEAVLEPSAGHGAIARWFPENTSRTVVEPSPALSSRLKMVSDAKLLQENFEDLHVVNKYDAIVMNPPFGVGGKTAIEHLDKAAQHLREGGRIVALVPTGPAADKRFEKWFYEEAQRAVKPLMEHPTLGPVYRGDTIATRASWAAQGVVSRRDADGGVWLKVPGKTGETQVAPEAWTGVEKKGPRTETYRPAEGLHLVADIQLPSVTFERAGTSVAAKVVIIDKVSDNDKAVTIQQVSRDYSDEGTIKNFFSRIESASIPGRIEKPAQEVSGDGQFVEHTTQKGRVLRGVVRKDLTKEQAKEIDPYTFGKDGGWFIREKYLTDDGKIAEDGTDNIRYSSKEKAASAVRLEVIGEATDEQSRADIRILQRAVEADRARTRGGKKRGPGRLTPVQVVGDRVIRQLAGIFGKRVVFFKAENGGVDFDGAVLKQSNPDVIYISVEADHVPFTILGHELVHTLSEDHPKLYKHLKNTLTAKNIMKDSALGEFIAEYREKHDAHNLGEDYITEEMIANFIGDNFADPAFWEAIGLQEPSLFEQIVRAVVDFIEKVLAKIAGEAPSLKSHQYFSDIKKARDAVVWTMAEYAKRQQGKNSSLKTEEAPDTLEENGGNNEIDGREDSKDLARMPRINKEGYRGMGETFRDVRGEEHSAGEKGAESPFRPVTKEDFSSEAFNKWFGNSQAVDEDGEPLTFHHGSHTFGEPSGSYVFGENKGRPKSPRSALGHFFTEDRTEAAGYGNVGAYVLRLEKPLIIESWQLPAFHSVEAAEQFVEAQKEMGHDGIYLRDEGHAIIFDSNQAKSLDRQTGEFSRENDDVRYSKKDPLSADNLQEVAGSIRVLRNKKVDSTFLDRIFSTPEYYFKKFAAAGRVLMAALNRRDLRFKKEQEILEDYATYIQELKKNDKAAYEEANDYLIHADQTATGWRLRFTDDEKWKVVMPRWAVKLKEGEKFTPEKAVVGVYDDEQAAIKTMIQSEAEALEGKGYSAAAVEAIRRARELTNRGFDIMAADMRRIIQEAAENGQPNPYIGDGKLDESGRYGIYQKGKSRPIALYATEQEANEALAQAAEMMSYVVTLNGKKKGQQRTFNNILKAKAWAEKHSGTVEGMKRFQNLRVKRRSDADMRPLTVKQALAQMGDLRGIYFPRIRESGEYVLIARKDGENPIRKHFDIHLVGDKHPKLQELMKNLRVPIAREAFELKKKGYEVTIKRDDSPAEEVFEATNLISSLDAILQSSMSVIDKNSDADVRAGQHVNQILTLQVADIFKARGFLSSRIKRLAGDEVWEGYEEDMAKAMVQYGKNVASGTAKRDTARAMILAFSGRDYSWQQYKREVEKPDWGEYMKIVAERRIDEGKQKNLFRDVRNFMVDVLRNDEQADRIIGTMKGLAVLKYLGFRVSSAAINMTNMVQGVPATLAGHTGESIPDALGRVITAATAYGKYRTGKGSDEDKKIFDYISAKGWDEAQFNYEAASVLRSKVGETWNKFMTASMFLFGAAEKTNRAVTLYAAYKAVRAKEKTMEEDEVWRLAKEISDRAHGVYGKETLPAWARGKYNLLRLTYTFQKFSHNYMLNMIDLGFTRKEYKAAAYMLLSPALLAGAGASIASPVLFAAAGALGLGGDDPEEAWYDWMEELFGGGSFARHGLFGLVGINIKGSLQMTIPGANIADAKAIDLFGPAGGILSDTAKGFHHLFRGELAKGAESLLPTAFGSMSKSIREATEGITTSNYGTVFYGDEPLKADAADAFLRFLSFNPARISGIREKQWNEKEVAARYQEDKTAIYAKIKRLYLDEKGLTPEILKEIKWYNDRVLASGRRDIKPITPSGIREMLKRNSKASKIERMRAVEV